MNDGELTLFLAAMPLRYLMTSQLAAESSPLVGSSRNRILGLVMSWLATPTRRFWPPLIPLRIGVPMSVSAWSRSPKESSSPSMRAMRSFLGSELVLARREAKCSVSRTVRAPIKASSCSTKRLISRKAARDGLLPLTRTAPSTLCAPVGREASTLRRVVLPQPEGPMRAHISPSPRRSA